MNDRDLIGAIFVAVFVPLIIAIAALCLRCHCHLQRGRKRPRRTQSYTVDTDWTDYTSPPFEPAYHNRRFKQPSKTHSKRYASYRYEFGLPRYAPRVHSTTTRHVPSRRQTREQHMLHEMYDGLDITPEMARPRKRGWVDEGSLDLPGSAFDGLDLTREHIGGPRESEMMAQAREPRRQRRLHRSFTF